MKSGNLWSRFRVLMVKIISLPIYLLDAAYDLVMAVFFTSTQKAMVSGEQQVVTNLQMNIHKVQKSQSFPKVEANRNKGALKKINALLKKPVSDSFMVSLGAETLAAIEEEPQNNDVLVKEYSPADVSTSSFEDLVLNRHSVRNFSSQKVPVSVILKIIELAKQAPSVCNRQEWRVHCYQQKDDITRLLKLQNGNKGWGEVIENLLVITCDNRKFTTSSERNQGFIDGGMFAMNLILAARSMGLETCCLNQSNYFFKDLLVHRAGKIPIYERIIMFIAIGYVNPPIKVATSQRYKNETFLTTHQ